MPDNNKENIDRIAISDINVNECKSNKLYSYNDTIVLSPLESELNTIKTEMVNNSIKESNINENKNSKKKELLIHVNSTSDYLDDKNSEINSKDNSLSNPNMESYKKEEKEHSFSLEISKNTLNRDSSIYYPISTSLPSPTTILEKDNQTDKYHLNDATTEKSVQSFDIENYDQNQSNCTIGILNQELNHSFRIPDSFNQNGDEILFFRNSLSSASTVATTAKRNSIFLSRSNSYYGNGLKKHNSVSSRNSALSNYTFSKQSIKNIICNTMINKTNSPKMLFSPLNDMRSSLSSLASSASIQLPSISAAVSSSSNSSFKSNFISFHSQKKKS